MGLRTRHRVLVVDDDPQILRYVRNTLSKAGSTPVVTGDVDEVSKLLESESPQLVLVNLVLPGVDGFELLKRIRTDHDTPVIVLSGRGRGRAIAKAFELGAADFVVKPFSTPELVAALRQAVAHPHSGIEPRMCGDLAVNHLERAVTLAGKPVRLTPTEYKLLLELSRHPGRVLTHDQLLNRVWSENHPADQRCSARSSRTCATSWETMQGTPLTSSPSPASGTASLNREGAEQSISRDCRSASETKADASTYQVVHTLKSGPPVRRALVASSMSCMPSRAMTRGVRSTMPQIESMAPEGLAGPSSFEIGRPAW